MKLESEVQEKCIKMIRKYGGYVYKNAQNMYTEKGRPDLTACIPITIDKFVETFGMDKKIGLFVGLEIKRDKDSSYDVTEAQQIVGNKIKRASGLWFKIDDVDVLEALLHKLTEDTNAI